MAVAPAPGHGRTMPRRRDEQLQRTLGARIQAIRLERGLTQEQMARMVDLRPATISRLECGTLNTSLANLSRIAVALEVGLSELLDVEIEVPEASIPPDEQALLSAYRALDEERRRIALRLVEGLGRE